MPATARGSRLLTAARGGSAEAVKREITGADLKELQELHDASGANPLHLAALGAHEDAVEALLECDAAEAWLLARELNGGATPLHYAVKSAVPMVAYQLASKQPSACLEQDGKQQTAIQLAATADKGEVLNAMLLACAGHATATSLAATRSLLAAGAVCDTWAPNGSSALMLAASADCAEGVGLLLDHAASLELQDALGRTALMFAAGNNARAALEVLLDRGASVSIRDRRGRNVMDYAAEGSEVRRVLETRIAEMESRSAQLQEELLAELLADEASAALPKEQRSSKKGKKKKGKAGGKGKPEPEAAQPELKSAEAGAAKPTVAECSEPDAAKVLQLQDHKPSSVWLAVTTPEAPAAEGKEADLDHGERPASPDWQVVGRPSRQQRSSLQSSQQEPHSHHGLHPRLVDGDGSRMRRCPSASSLGSSSSGDSHETAGASSVGSQRSVLLHPSRIAASRPLPSKPTASKPVVIVAAPPPAKPAWSKPAAAPAVPLAMGSAQPAQPSVSLPDVKSPAQQPAPAQEAQPAKQSGLAVPAVFVPAGLPLAEAQDASALAAEVAALRAQLAQAQLERQQAEEQHQQDLAAVVSEAAAHEATAVLEAVTAERTRCIYRFAAFLQNSNVAPELLASYGVTGTAAGFATSGISVPAAAPSFSSSGPQASLLRLSKTLPVAVPAAPAPLLPSGDLSTAASLSPLSSSPTFCYTALEQRLREEFTGDVSRFLQPAAAELT